MTVNLFGFIKKDHKYVLLYTAAVAAAALSLINSRSNIYSFIREDSTAELICGAVLWAAVAFCVLLMALRRILKQEKAVTALNGPVTAGISRWLSYSVTVIFVLLLADRAILGFAALVSRVRGLDSNPPGFGESMVYMTINGRAMLLTGIWTTVRIALLGTGIAFILAIFMVFLRIMEPDKRDSDLVKALKWTANAFTRLYIFVIRGTPMMVQTLIFYYFGFNLFKRTGMTVTEINQVWSFFISGLFTVSLNSTAYLTEVLRGGILAVDKGQTEAARSLGMSNWQAMTKVVFPQAVKNSIPAIGNEFIINIKDSSVLSVIGVMDLMYATKSVSGIYYRSLEIYCVAALVYLVLTWLSSRLLNRLGRRLDVPVKELPSSN